MSYIYGSGAGSEPMANLYSQNGARNMAGIADANANGLQLTLQKRGARSRLQELAQQAQAAADAQGSQQSWQSGENAANRDAENSRFGQEMGFKKTEAADQGAERAAALAQHAQEFGTTESRLSQAQQDEAANRELMGRLHQQEVEGNLALGQTQAQGLAKYHEGELANRQALLAQDQQKIDEDKRRYEDDPKRQLMRSIFGGGGAKDAAKPQMLNVDGDGPDAENPLENLAERGATSTTSTSGSESPGAAAAAIGTPAGPVGSPGDFGAKGNALAGLGGSLGGGDPLKTKLAMAMMGVKYDPEGEHMNHEVQQLQIEDMKRRAAGEMSPAEKRQRDEKETAAAVSTAQALMANEHMQPGAASLRALAPINAMRARRGETPLTVEDLNVQAPYVDTSSQGIGAALSKLNLGTPEAAYQGAMNDVIDKDPATKTLFGFKGDANAWMHDKDYLQLNRSRAVQSLVSRGVDPLMAARIVDSQNKQQ